MTDPAKSKNTYYVRVDTYWQNSPDSFIGPFASRADAQTAIDAALDAPNSLAVLAGNSPRDIKEAVRIHGILSKTEARKFGLRDWSLGDNESNCPSGRVPVDGSDLAEMYQ